MLIFISKLIRYHFDIYSRAAATIVAIEVMAFKVLRGSWQQSESSLHSAVLESGPLKIPSWPHENAQSVLLVCPGVKLR